LSQIGGGKGANQAAGIAKLLQGTSRRVQYCGQFGNDSHAPMLADKLRATGCDTSLCHTVDGATGQAFIILYTGGDNSVILVGGANQNWPSQLYDDLKQAIVNAAVVVLQREIPQRINTLVAQVALYVAYTLTHYCMAMMI
jgi:ribokinase